MPYTPYTWVNGSSAASADRLNNLETGVQEALAAAAAAIPVGTMLPWAASAAPDGWQLCIGTAISRETYAALFALIGTTFGSGDGSTTFNLPNMRGRFPLGKAVSGTGSALGETGGIIDHEHTVSGQSAPVTGSGSTGPATATTTIYDGAGGARTPASSGHGHAVSVSGAAAVGARNTDGKNPPYLALNWIIKAE